MRLPLLCRLAPIACLPLVVPAAAHADETPPYPATVSDRPLTLEESMFTVGGQVFMTRGLDAPIVSLLGTLDYGIHDNVTIGVNWLNVALSPDAGIPSQSLYGAWRFFADGSTELAADLALRFPVQDDTFGLLAGLSARFHVDDQMLDLSVAFPTTFDGDDTHVGLLVKVHATWNMTPEWWLQLQTGLSIGDLGVAHNTFVPVGLGLGYTLARPDNSPLADFFVQFGLPTAMWIDNPAGQAPFQLGMWSVMLGARYLH